MKLKKRKISKVWKEVLEEGETIFGSRTGGNYMVREYEDC